ncbi:hypothetical protein JNW88_06465, partial [Micromonospora sp. ATA32]|nr:hypothetical protein [Micromonospora sp. ATA32]
GPPSTNSPGICGRRPPDSCPPTRTGEPSGKTTSRAELDRPVAAGVVLPEVRAFGRPALDELAGHLRETPARLLPADPNWRTIWEDHVAPATGRSPNSPRRPRSSPAIR